MSRYAKYIIIGLFMVAPKITSAATVHYEQKQWELTPQITQVEQSVTIRNTFDLKSMAGHVLLGKKSAHKIKILDETSLSQIEKIISEVNRPTSDAVLKIENDWATQFTPDQSGQSVDLLKLSDLLATSSNVTLPVILSQPQIKLADLNNLGIVELVAVGESDFTGSSKNRITNITVGASRFNGLILKPGEEFSFNKYLGPVDAAHGFKPEIVIKREGLLPEYGGGLCQVSSTAFRAAMNGGMKITARRNHSFAVRYYTPAGSDATIYDPVQDFKFVNDYPGHLLVRTRMEGNKLYYEYYSTKDTRLVELDGPHQYDQKPDGSLKAVWTKRVTKNGVTDEQVFRSTYVSPALYQRVATTEANPGTPPPAPTPAPAPTPTPTPPNT